MTDTRITILGDGQMGLVCAAILANRPDAPRVTLWGHRPQQVVALAGNRTSTRLKGFVLPEPVQVVADDAAALDGANLIVCAVPTQHIRGVFTRVGRHVRRGDGAPGVVSFSKGIENSTMLLPTAVIADALGELAPGKPPARPLAALSGPTIAAELAHCMPATMVAASDDAAFAGTLQDLFTTNWLRIYTHPDLLGVELAGATKNVIAIAAGVIDGLGAGYNAKSALLARGLAEIARLGVAMGAQRETFFGVAGVGDLATTCFSPEGRNRSLGEALGKGEKLNEYLARTESVVEGVATTKSVVDLARRKGVEMPIAAAVHAVLFEGLDPLDAIALLMTREPKRERVG
ncbi:MAG: NAD(P)H-dependent glycerol-3-phosphate dehydrogenase [Phycisphaerales bacterium]